MSLSSEVRNRHTFTWKIKNLSLCTQGKDEYFESPFFRARSISDSTWYMKLYPRGEESSDDGYMGCYLCRCGDDVGPYEIDCDFEVIMMSSDGKLLKSQTDSCRYELLKDKVWGWKNFIKKSIYTSFTCATDDVVIKCIMKSNERRYPLRSENAGTTKFDVNKYTVKWIVKNLNKDCLEVINFPHVWTSQVEILLEAPEDDVTIAIRNGDDASEPQSVLCRITLLDVEGRNTEHILYLLSATTEESYRHFHELPTFLKKSKLNSEKEKYLRADCFELLIEIVFSNGRQSEYVEDKEWDSSTSVPAIGTLSILEDFKRLHKDKTHADVKLLVSNQVILAHKNILSIRSPVFFAMFDTDMVENKTSSVNIPDFEIETVNSLLEYMYTGSLEKLDYELSLKLIVAADKYQILSLKEECANFLQSILSDKNICDVLAVAELIQQEPLKCTAMKYLKNNCDSIFLSENWNSVVEKNLPFATEILRKVSKLIAAEK